MAIVLSEQWDTLDFEDVDKELANKLTDDDISAVLNSINAHDVLKRLKLCGCSNITGIGLNPLRDSVVLEQLDISLVGKHDNPRIEPEPKISEEAVLPILDGIISSDGCTLKYIQFPWKWRGRPPGMERYTFSRRYNQQLNTRGICCSKCNRRMTNEQEWLNGMMVNTKICYDCLKPICTQCDMDEEADFCQPFHCEGDGCDNYTCSDCRGISGDFDVKECEECRMVYCASCRFNDVKERYKERGYASCDSCVAETAPLILRENAQLSKEVDELKDKVASMSL